MTNISESTLHLDEKSKKVWVGTVFHLSATQAEEAGWLKDVELSNWSSPLLLMPWL